MRIFQILSLLLLGLGNSLGQSSRFFRVAAPVRITSLTPDGLITWTNEPIGPNFTAFTVQTTTALGAENSWVDWVKVPVTGTVTTHRLFDLHPPAGMSLVPGGSFRIGDAIGDSPVQDAFAADVLNVSAFYLDQTPVTKALWDEVYTWAASHDYTFANSGSGKGADHPVQTVSWYDAVKWCNARSEKEGRAPAYFTDAGLTVPYRTGALSPRVNWNAGYRLPTEAEWEKAARGGLSGKRFPWGNVIDHTLANYYAYPDGYSYDADPVEGYHPAYSDDGFPFTSSVHSFAPNGYGLHDMAGNVSQWCWDWYGTAYSGDFAGNPYNGGLSDPRGPSSGTHRTCRGGTWYGFAQNCQSFFRSYIEPDQSSYFTGFRTVLPPSP